MAERLEVPTRQELVRRYERDYLLRNPEARIGENTIPGIDARCLADQLLPLYAEALRLASAADIENTTGTDLETWAAERGLPRRLPAAGASGAVIVGTSVGGVTIQNGLQLRHKQTGKRYRCTRTDIYETGAQVPIAGVDTGPSTDMVAGTILEWSAPPPGLSTIATVVEQSDGSGLTGGRDVESDADIRARIRSDLANPAHGGTSAEYRATALKTPNLAVQAAFTYPAVLGPGTIGLAFTMRPGSTGASRRPNATQIAAVRAYIIGQMPADDSLFMYALLDDPIALDLLVRWRRTAVGWADPDPWPAFGSEVEVSAVTSSTVFTVDDLGAPVPHAGQSIAFWDNANRRFVRKRIASVTPGDGTRAITCDTSNSISDTSFTPAIGDRPFPWSDSLATLVDPVLASFDQLGPSDHASFDTGGLRRRREPTGYEAYPSELSGRILIPIYAVPAVDDVRVAAPSLPRATPSGAYGSTAYLTSLAALRVYPIF